MSKLPSASQKMTDDEKAHEAPSSYLYLPYGFSAELPVTEQASDEGKNPFHLSPDTDFFVLRDKERERLRLEKEAKKTQKVHEKMTYFSKIAAKSTNLQRQLQTEDHMEEQAVRAEAQRLRKLRESASCKISITKDKKIERENLTSYIEQKRQMFLLQYALEVKREEILRLEMLAIKEEMKLEKAEKFLEKDASLFDEFLKENDRNSAQAMKIADKESKAKMEKIFEIRDLTAQILMIKSEISKFEDNVQIFKLYRDFLYKMSPKKWLMTHAKKYLAHATAKMTGGLDKEQIPFLPVGKGMQKIKEKINQNIPDSNFQFSIGSEAVVSKGDKFSPMSSSSQNTQSSFRDNPSKKQLNPLLVSAEEERESDDELELYFTEPRQLLDIFTDLEEQNLSLIQDTQDTEEALEEVELALRNARNKMDREINQLKLLSSTLLNSITKEEDTAADLELKSRVFSYGEYKGDYQNKMLASLNKKVVEVYHHCIGDCETSLSTLQMLTIIEHQLDELLENLERIPHWKLEQVEKDKEKERRIRIREEKMKRLKEDQEERLQRALARAQATVKKKTGRKLMYRSEPVLAKSRNQDTGSVYDKEKEELLFFFT
ncbi:cilia- and flagella-associated protein 100 [Macrotis lagotis]|uniref:cilia- and flagella-associated protein 100 n=1 Tax=Macrotis lagotis TaxID=92651 RepID=UPI003D69DA63